MEKSPEAFRTISEVAEELDVPQHVLRFWESKFNQIKPMKRGGGRRYYRPNDVDLLRGIRHLLYGDGYTIRGVQKILREQGISFVVETGRNTLLSQRLAPGAGPRIERVDPPVLDTAAVEAAQEASGLDRDHVQILQATLQEISEIKRLLEDTTTSDGD
jgi:DNA-binding transcriptional MerR regulator